MRIINTPNIQKKIPEFVSQNAKNEYRIVLGAKNIFIEGMKAKDTSMLQAMGNTYKYVKNKAGVPAAIGMIAGIISPFPTAISSPAGYAIGRVINETRKIIHPYIKRHLYFKKLPK